MPQPLRFRVYDHHTKELSGPDGLRLDLKDGVITHISCQYSEYGEWGSAAYPLDQDRYKIMQFTGMIDDKGTAIYEGDIVALDHWSPKTWEVTFNRGGFCFRNKPDDPYWHDIKYLERGTVIGNIYQHPELLIDPEPEPS